MSVMPFRRTATDRCNRAIDGSAHLEQFVRYGLVGAINCFAKFEQAGPGDEHPAAVTVISFIRMVAGGSSTG